MKRVKDAFDERAAALDGLLGVGRSFDMIGRTLRIGGRRARLWVVNGYADDTVLERAISAWLPIPSLEDVGTLQAFADRYVSVCDAAVETDRLKAVTAVFAGKTLLVIDGFSGGVVLDAKQFPLRSVEEPDTSKVLRGSHDGFGESVMKNAALLRRRIRDSQLTLESLQVGTRSRTDVVLCYMENRVDRSCWISCGKSWRPWTWAPIAHESGERGGGHRPAPMVEPLPQDPLYRAARTWRRPRCWRGISC